MRLLDICTFFRYLEEEYVERRRNQMKTLVIAEKPSVARDIARVLNCTKKLPGALEGNKYIITWALGHLVTLANPDTYNTKYKTWNIADLPMLPKKWELIVIPQTAKQYNLVKTQMYRKDIADIIIATDAGREGELVARWILEKANIHKPLFRLWISSVTDKAICDGFQNLKDGKNYEALYHAATGRAKADWLVGINATRALTCKYNAQLSCGRVQTPTLFMIYNREQEIKDFTPKDYYTLNCNTDGVNFSWMDKKSGTNRSFDKAFITNLMVSLKGTSLKVVSINKTKKKTYAPGLYDLTELQRDANRRFGFSAKETLNIAQRLYENHKVLTYPRTDSKFLGTDIIPTLRDRLLASGVGVYKQAVSTILRKRISTNSSFVNDEKVSDHHAIIPTEESVIPSRMSNDEKKIYDLVIRRFIAIFHPPFEYEQTTIVAEAASEEFVARGKRILIEGWKVVYWEYDEETESEDHIKEQHLPEIKTGDLFSIVNVSQGSDKTKPPAKFSEATLLSAMENPARFIKGATQKVKQTLNETGGLGTVATRADIIEKLFSSFLIEKNGNELSTTSKGRQLLKLVPDDLKSPNLTASWESDLTRIAKGTYKEDVFIQKIEEYTKDIIGQIKSTSGDFKHNNLTNSKCPRCGKRMLAVNGKSARLLVCQDRECGYRETVARTTNARCPSCHKKMELIKKGDSETFICPCGHKEKLETFQKRRKKEGAGVSKKEVNRYLKNQGHEVATSSLGDILKKL